MRADAIHAGELRVRRIYWHTTRTISKIDASFPHDGLHFLLLGTLAFDILSTFAIRAQYESRYIT